MNKEEIEARAKRIAHEWADQGKLIEGGWQALVIVGGFANLPQQQLDQMRQIYMLGAQHTYAGIIMVLDPSREVTERDMFRMSMIRKELDDFRKSMVT